MNPPSPHPPVRMVAPYAALLCLVLATAAHAAAVKNGWVLDDVPVVRDNPALARGVGGVPALFRAPSWPGDLEEQPSRPLALASLAVERRAWEAVGLAAVNQGIHALNVLLHGLASMLLLGLLSRALPHRRGFAVGTAVVFALHPLATGVISSGTGRADLLAVLFGLLALHAWLRYAPGRPATLPLCALAFFLALLSKESAVGLPFVALVLDRAARGLPPSQAVRRRWPGYLALATTLALWLVLWPGPGRPGVAMPEPGVATRLVLGLEALGRQTVAVLLPVGLLPDRSVEAVAGVGYALRGATLFTAMLSGIGLLLAALVPARAAGARALKGVVCAAGGLALAQALTLPLGGGLEDRAAYLLLPALAGLGGLALEALMLPRAGRVPPLGFAGAALALVALFLLTAREAAAWHDDETVHARLLLREPGHGPALLRRAERLMEEAQRERTLASALRSNDPRVEDHRRRSREARSRAMELALAAARLTGMREDPEVYLLLGILHLDDDRPPEAEQYLRRARSLDPLLKAGGRQGAGHDDARALERAARLYAALGRAYQALARMDAAADAYEEAVRWDRRAAHASGRGPDAALAHTAGTTMIGDGRFADGLLLLADVASTAPDPELRRLAAADHQRLQKAGQGRLGDLMAQARSRDAEREEKAALDTYLEALRVDPGTVEARERAAYYLGKIFGRYPHAKTLVEDGLALLERAPAGPTTDSDRKRLTTLLSDLQRWDRESAEQEARDMEQFTPKPPTPEEDPVK